MLFGTNFGAPAAAASPVARVQRALSLLALAKGDASIGVKVDGATGPQTAAAVNKALTKYAPNAPAALRTGKLTPAQVKQNAGPIASTLEQAAAAKPPKPASKPLLTNIAAKAAGMTPAPPPKARATRAQVQKLQLAVRALGSKTGDKSLAIGADGIVGPQTLVAINKTVKSHGVFSRQVSAADLADPQIVETIAANLSAKANAVSKPVAPAAAKQTSSPTVQRLQQALTALGKKVNDKALQIGADGLLGPKTRAAVNKALTAYVKGAAAALRTGRLTDVQIVQNAESLAKAVEQEIARRGATPPKKPASSPPPGVKRSPQITQIQQSLGQLGQLVNDEGLILVVDGINGPKTAAAVNSAMLKYVRSGPASMRTGKLSVAQVSASAQAIINALGVEIARRGQPQEAAPPTPQPSPEPENTVPPEQETPAEAQASVPEQAPPSPSMPAPPAEQQAPVPTQFVPQDEAPYVPQNEAAPAPSFVPEYFPPTPAPQQTPAVPSYSPSYSSEAAQTPAYPGVPAYSDPSYNSDSYAPQASAPDQNALMPMTPPPAPSKASKWPLYAGIGLGAVTLTAVGYFAFRPKKSYRR